MRPTVLPTPEIAADEARKERNRLAGVKQAELELMEEKRQNDATIEKELSRQLKERQNPSPWATNEVPLPDF